MLIMLEIAFSSITHIYTQYWLSLKINLMITVAKSAMHYSSSFYTKILGISKGKYLPFYFIPS